MIQINLLPAKEWLFKNWAIVVLVIVSFLYFKSCQGSEKLQLANSGLKKENKELVISADKYVAKNNELNGKIVLLEQQKQKVKIEKVYIQNKTKSEAEKVQSLSTKQIAVYYQERYKLPVTITQYGVSLSDTIAKKNIVELVQKDGCFQEIKLVQSELQIEEQKRILKDSINGNLTSANLLLKTAITNQDQIIENTEKAFKKEKAKKTFWKVATGAAIIGSGYLLITK